MELDFILKHMRQRQHEINKFNAAVQGINLDKSKESDSAVERARKNAAARLAGGKQEVEKAELADLGFGYESL